MFPSSSHNNDIEILYPSEVPSLIHISAFVNYVYLLSDSYRVMLDTIHDYAKSTGIIKRFYLEEINASSLKFAGAFFESLVHVPIFNEDDAFRFILRNFTFRRRGNGRICNKSFKQFQRF